MNKKFRKIAASVLALSLAAANVVMPQAPVVDIVTEISASAATETGTYNYGGTTCAYTIQNGYATLNSVESTSSSAVVLPTTIPHNGTNYTVTAISNNFAKNLRVRTITLPNKVKKIGSNFAYGAAIASINIPSTVVEIGSNFCMNCSSLYSVSYSGTSLNKLGSNALKNTMYIDAGNSNGAVMMGDWLIKYLGSASSINVSTLDTNNVNITKIANYAFAGNTSISYINLSGVKNIGAYAFHKCSALRTVSLGSTSKLTTIGNYAFYQCSALNTFDTSPKLVSDINNHVVIPDSVTSIGTGAFNNCINIHRVYLNDKKSVTVGLNAFKTGYNNTTLITRDETTTADEVVYDNTARTTTVNDAYGNTYTCEALDIDPAAGVKIQITNIVSTTVSVPSSVTIEGVKYSVVEIDNDFLKENKTVKTVTFPSSVKRIGQFVCADTTALTRVNLSSNLESIGYASFYNSSALTKVICSSTVLDDVDVFCFKETPWFNDYATNNPKADAMMIGTHLVRYYGDRYNGRTTEINLVCNNGVYTHNGTKLVKRTIKSIGCDAFSTCNDKLKTINLSGVTAVDDRAFKKNALLESVEETDSIVRLGEDLFHANILNKLKEQTSNKNYIMIGSVLYQWLGTGAVADLTANTNLTFISEYVFPDTAVTTLKLPKNSNLYIADMAFKDSKITEIKYNNKTLDYANIKANTDGMYDFYMRNYAGLECCKATYTQLIQPMCKAYLSEMGLTYYGKVRTNLTPAQQVKIAGTVYRYLSKSVNYEIIFAESGAMQSAGEFTLLTNRGACGPQARAYAYLLNCAGVNAQLVGGPGHAWNIVKIGNEWMHADVCWKNMDKWFLRTSKEFYDEGEINRAATDVNCHKYEGYADSIGLAYGIGTTVMETCDQPMGDVNGDGLFNTSDYTMLNQYINYGNVMTKPEYADLNGDGKVNTIDRAYMQSRLFRK